MKALTQATTVREKGWEWKAAIWVVKHPGMVAIPTALGGGMIQFGPEAMGIGAAVTAVGALGWYRGHPVTWDTWIAPRLRSMRRRWLSTAYTGKYWLRKLNNCGLWHVGGDGIPVAPRVIRVRAHSPFSETVYVKLPEGQTIEPWLDAREALTMALAAERITVELVSKKKRVMALIVQRDDPFKEVITPDPVPTNSETVDLGQIHLGTTEFGTSWRAPIVGQHWLVSGAMGSGKSSILWMLLRAIAPLIRDGIVRLWVADPKEIEFAKLAPVCHRYTTATPDIWTMIDEYWSIMEQRKADLAKDQARKFQPSRETPLDILLIDELAAVVAYGGEPRQLREVHRVMSLIMSQARALGGSVVGAVQEPTKEVVQMRELFTWRACLRSTSAQHPDMVLGDDMRLRGGLADEIPNIVETAGTGYVVQQRTRTPVNVRAAYVDDDYIDDIIRIAGWPMTELNQTTTEQDATTVEPETEEATDGQG